MDIVVDANILFAACIRDGLTRALLFHTSLRPYVPAFVFEEVTKHKATIEKKTRNNADAFFAVLRTYIEVVPEEELLPFLEEALQISPDPNDVHYIALARKLRCPLWSQDKKLKEQRFVQVFTTEEMKEQVA
ncbi:MAG: PIN domain-containing protein [Candidatus Woesearchaeota archaeon]|nr:PIN domain-containing protein [Candidatus Woesearchaeota archaeon]